MIECPHAARCGGCALIELDVEQQHRHKRDRVVSAVSAYAPLRELSFQPLVAAETVLQYRTRAKLVVSPGGEIGLYARASHEVVDIPDCRVLSPALLEVVEQLRVVLGAGSPVSAVDLRETHDGERNGVLLTLIGPKSARAAARELAAQIAAQPHVLGVAFSARDSDSPQVLGGLPEPICGPDAVRDRASADGPYHYASHGGFAQAHRGQAAKLVAQVIGELTRTLGELRGARVLELYAGAGALGLRLATLGAKPLLVERFEPALAHAERAAREQHLDGVATRAEDAEAALQQLVAAGAEFEAVVVNPPRRGLPATVRALLGRISPRVLVYVSCDPDTLARDLADLAHQGLVARELTPYDLLPLAADVESVVTLTPAADRSWRILHDDDALLAVDKPPHLPTVPQREHAASLLERLQRDLSLPDLRPVHRLDLGTSGVCLFAKTREAATSYAAALAAGQKHYLALVRGRVHEKGNVKKALAEDGQLREALTRYTRKALIAGHSLVRVRPVQGRTHQIRRHLAAIGHPVLGDARYGDPASNRYFEHRHGLDRTFLHLARLELLGPEGKVLALEAPLAPDLEAVLRSLGEDRGSRGTR